MSATSMSATSMPEQKASWQIDSLTIFSWVWAAQSLIQLAFFRDYTANSPVVAWTFFALAVAVVLFPGRMWLFIAMLVASIATYIASWPFVSNHIFLDTFMAATMLGGLALVWLTARREGAGFDRGLADRWFSKFAPVCGAIFAFMYFAIIISKLNEGFFDLEISCLSGMIEEAQASRPFVSGPLSLFSVDFLFWFFIVAEAALPVMLVFRRTRLLAFYFGVPFHVLLGLMGHWSFSSFMLAFYVLLGMPSFKQVVRDAAGIADTIRRALVPWLPGSLLFAGAGAVMVAAAAYTKPSWVWLLVAAGLAAGLLLGAAREHFRNGLFTEGGVMPMWTAKPGILWAVLALAVINSASPYLGFKTSTNVAMYSNMRTEGGVNNHLFMPSVSLFDYQRDLVEIVDTNSPQIAKMKTHKARYGFEGQQFRVMYPYFELRRAVSNSQQSDLYVTYIRDGELREYRRGEPGNGDADIDDAPPMLVAKLAYFRPVFKGERSYCLH